MVKQRIILLVLFLALAAGFIAMDRYGYDLHVLSDVVRPKVEVTEETIVVGQRSLAGFIAAAALIVVMYEIFMLLVIARVKMRKGANSEITMLAALMRVGAVLATLIALLYFMGKISAWGTAAAGFAGMLMGWSLQAPVSGIAAWVLVSIKRPFRVGDRVMLPAWGLTGDVLRIDMMYTTLNQVGGTVASEEAAGRNILIPNAILFGNVVINYTPQQAAAFLLDEVVIRITFNSNWEKAERILISAASEVTGDIIQQTGQKPYIRADLSDWYGVIMRLRYMTHATDRPRIVSEIAKRIVGEFQKHPDVDFAIPYIFSHRTGMRTGAWYLGQQRDKETVEANSDTVHDPQGVGQLPQNADQVKTLAEKIAQLGLLQPIVVDRRQDGQYNVVAGHLRLAACKLLGWKTIPVIIRSTQESVRQGQ